MSTCIARQLWCLVAMVRRHFTSPANKPAVGRMPLLDPGLLLEPDRLLASLLAFRKRDLTDALFADGFGPLDIDWDGQRDRPFDPPRALALERALVVTRLLRTGGCDVKRVPRGLQLDVLFVTAREVGEHGERFGGVEDIHERTCGRLLLAWLDLVLPRFGSEARFGLLPLHPRGLYRLLGRLLGRRLRRPLGRLCWRLRWLPGWQPLLLDGLNGLLGRLLGWCRDLKLPRRLLAGGLDRLLGCRLHRPLGRLCRRLCQLLGRHPLLLDRLLGRLLLAGLRNRDGLPLRRLINPRGLGHRHTLSLSPSLLARILPRASRLLCRLESGSGLLLDWLLWRYLCGLADRLGGSRDPPRLWVVR